MQSIDLFCSVIDNYGDAGGVYRLAKELSYALRDARVRVFTDNVEIFHRLLPSIHPTQPVQTVNAVKYIDSHTLTEEMVERLGVADFVIETLGCGIPEVYEKRARRGSRARINLEALTAEAWAREYHLKQSLMPTGEAPKFFFMPGFTTQTGGILIDSDADKARPTSATQRHAYIAAVAARCGFMVDQRPRLVGTIFTYGRRFDGLIRDLRALSCDVLLFVCGEKSHQGMLASLPDGTRVDERHHRIDNIDILFLPFLPQHTYDVLLFACDFNIVRGEDSLARAVVTGKPFLWNAYLQKDRHHLVKVNAFLEWAAPFFADPAIFGQYRELMLSVNSKADEQPRPGEDEDYSNFFKHLHEIEISTLEINHFIRANCDLIRHFSAFLRSIPFR